MWASFISRSETLRCTTLRPTTSPCARAWLRRCSSALLLVVLMVGTPLWGRSHALPGSSSPSSLNLPLPGLPGVAPGSIAPWNIVILLTLLTMIPAILLSMTPFVRLLIVFHFLRQALGTQTAPSNQTLIGLSLILTFFLMQPVGNAIYSDAIVPLDAGHITMMAALDRSAIPMRHFMLKYAREKDLALFVELAHEPRPARPDDLGMRIVAPAYLLSELQAGFRIGAALFLPFLVIDMVTAAITTSIGMMQLPPVIISTPLKILLFVVVDGWNLLVGSLMRSFS